MTRCKQLHLYARFSVDKALYKDLIDPTVSWQGLGHLRFMDQGAC